MAARGCRSGWCQVVAARWLLPSGGFQVVAQVVVAGGAN